MKKFTLLIAMLLCFVAFGQKGTSSPTLEYPTKATQKVEKKQITNQNKLPYANFKDVPESVYAGLNEKSNAKKNQIKRVDLPFENLTSIPKATIESLNSRKASLKAKKVAALVKATNINRTMTSGDYVDGVVYGSQTVTYSVSDYNGRSYNNPGGERQMPVLAYSSGPYFGIAGPPDVSMLEDVSLGMGTFGYGAQNNLGNRVADDIILADDYDITSLVFYAYQTGAPTSPASIQEISVQIWDGDPSVGGSTVIWGDPVTNVLSNKVWSDAYRQLESAPGGTNRAIQEITVDVTGLSLPAGTYWVDWGYVGDPGFSGPWQPPVNIIGQSTTGNAKQSLSGVWGDLVDVGPQGLPVDVYGDCTSCGGSGCTVGVYTDRASYDAEAAAANLEDWGGGPGGIAACDGPFSSAGNSCYAPGEILDGISVVSSNMAQADPVVYVENGNFGLPNDAVGSNFFADFTIVNFPNNDVNNFGMDIYGLIGGSTMEVRIFGTSGLITTETITDAGGAGVFFGYIAGETITSVEIEDLTGGTAELVAQVAFGECSGGGGGCVTGVFGDRPSFEAAFGGALTDEDFTGGPTVITSCDGPINSAGNSCYAAGEIVDGIDVRSLVPTDPSNDTVVIPDGALGNTGVYVGPNTFVDVLEIQFPNNDVNSFGVDLIMPLVGTPTDVTVSIYGTGGLIDTQIVTVTGDATPVFFGYIAGETVTRVEFEDPLGGGELIANASFGECTGGGGGGCGDFTYENVSPTGNGVPSQSFPDFPDFDAQAVDDVVLPGPDAGELCSLTITGTGAGIPVDPNNTVILTVYDNNAGVPGAVVFTETFPSSVDADGDGSFTLEPTGAPVLNPNTTYWVSVVVNMEFGVSGQWFWSSADDANDAAALWQNPGGGFGTCTVWDTFANCGVGGGLGPDLLMTAEFVAVPVITYDTCEGAREINCGTSEIGDTLTATPDNAVAPDCDTPTSAPGVWYKWTDTAGLASNVVLTTCSAVTDYDTKISVYTGSCGAPPLTCVAGNDDDPSCPNFQSTVEFESDGSSTYYILVHGFGGATGNFELSMSCTLIPPDNDMIVNAIDLDEVGCPFTDEDVAMPAATTENGTPTDCDITGAAGVWYKFTPEGDGFITGTIANPGPGTGSTNLSVNNGPLAGDYNPVAAGFGGAIPTNPLTEDAVVVIDDDTTGDPNDACDPILNGVDLDGKIAVLRRGACEFGFKALAAQNEGAIAVVVVNNQPGDPIVMGGGAVGDQVTIPVVMISDVEGEPIITELLAANTVNMTLFGTLPDVSSVTFYTAPDETSTEDELVLVDWFQNQCLPSVTATIPVVANQAYYCFVVNTGAISDIIFDNCQLSVDSNEIEGFAFYPNPASDRLNLTSIDIIEKVALYNILGQKVIDLDVSATTTQLDVSRLSVGTYIMKVSSNGQTGTYKVIKK